MTDFLGRELNVGDECVYLKNYRTGSSTIRKLMFKGVITKFKNRSIVFDNAVTVYDPNDVVKVRWSND